jgi:hypothetical protein
MPASVARRRRGRLRTAAGWVAAWMVAGGQAPAETAQVPALAASRNALIEAAAAGARRGLYPRAFRGEQSYWTLIGVEGGAQSGLMSEDGAVELGKGGVSVEPLVIQHGRLVTWADVAITQSLADGYLPIPSVTWRARGWRLKITSFAAGKAANPRLEARYELRNLTARRRTLILALAVRPMQVNGPEQFLNTQGGFSPISELDWDGARLSVNGRARLFPSASPSRFVATSSSSAVLAAALPAKGQPSTDAVRDAEGLASGALVWRLAIPARGEAEVAWEAPLAGVAVGPAQIRAGRDERRAAAAWRCRLGSVVFTVPKDARAVVDTLKTSQAIMLMSGNGPELRPGTRSYDRSWIRDGAMISEALARLGDVEVAANYLRWYAPYQFADGKVPCCVDARGADPTPENDSEGEFIFLAAEVYRYGGDKALLRLLWPRLEAAARYMDDLRRAERAAVRGRPDAAMINGLLPASISHEGYSAKPAYSYWDDFWALRGYDDAVFIAGTLGDTPALAWLTRSRDDFRADLLASVEASALAHHIDYIPGAADLGDFDATSTTIALAPGGEAERLPAGLLDNTFERYWRQFEARRDRDRTWEAYTPYELRAVGAYTRLGRPDRAQALLEFFLNDRRPIGWNGWAEVVGREARQPRFIGDMPHAWVASDYVRSVLDMFVYERDADHALVLAAGAPPRWFEGPAGVGVRNLRTPYGRLSWSARMRGDDLILRIRGDARPPGGFDFPWPFSGDPGPARFNGNAVGWNGRRLRLAGPGDVVIERR